MMPMIFGAAAAAGPFAGPWRVTGLWLTACLRKNLLTPAIRERFLDPFNACDPLAITFFTEG